VTYKFDESGITYWVRFFIDDNQRRDIIDGNVRDRIWHAMSRAKIELTYPSRTLHLHEVTEETRRLADEGARGRRLADLRRIDFLAQLPESAVGLMAERARSLRFATGETVIRQGDPGETMYVVHAGELVVRVRDPETNAETEIAHLGPGDFFGEMSVLTGAPRRATVVAQSSCQLYEIGHDAFHDVLKDHPDFADVISRVVGERRTSMVVNRPLESEQSTAPANSDLLQKIRSFFKLSG
ncbi:MAG: cyclic nucleotide-binding domain-containing protein, partial [Deltaproteobacteria bacterium]|nr:cyclic nucleotide-binding domain-containing protein [Deltaproteobacteria bacterium]